MRIPSLLRFLSPSPRHSSRRPAKASRKQRPALLLETLEDRTLPSAYVVTTTADSGLGSLRDAINQINADTSHTLYPSPGNPGVDEIDFAITAASDTGGGYNSGTGVATFTPHSALPAITNAVLLDGYTQGQGTPLAASRNDLAIGDDAHLKIVLDGSNAPPADGLDIASGNSTVRGLVIDNFGAGIALNGSGNDAVTGNFLGTDVTGLAGAWNGAGVSVTSPGNTIGGTSLADRNIIGGHDGVFFYVDSSTSASGNLVQGNYIGTNAAGTAALTAPDRRFGIAVVGNLSNTTIGGTTASAGNVISGWGTDVEMFGFADQNPTDNVVEGNRLGTNAAGTAAIGTNDGWGVSFDEGSSNNTIGGATPGAGNLISGHLRAGIYLGGVGGNTAQGNLIGTDATGTQPIPNEVGVHAGNDALIGGTSPGEGNTIAFNDGPAVEVSGTGDAVEGNSIYGNNDINDHTGQPIDNLTQDQDSVTTLPELNWPGGPFTGTDNSYVANVTLTQSGSTLYYSGTLYGLPNTRYLVTLNAHSPGASGFFEGTYFGSYYIYLTTDASGTASIPNQGYPAPSGFVTTQGTWTDFAQSYVAHSLGNYEQNYPVLTSASTSAGGTTVSGTLNGQANTTFRVEFFANAAPDATGYGEGQTYLGFANVTTDSSGNATFTASGLATLPTGQDYLSATATDPNGNTSQFSQDLDLLLTTPTITQSGGSTTVGFTLRNVSNVSYTLNWGDGSGPQTIPAGQSGVSHVYTAAGIYQVQATASNQAAAPPATATVVVSTAAGDQIGASGGTTAGQVVLTEASTSQAQTQAPTNMVVVSGDGGSDTYTVNFGSTLTTPLYLSGGGAASGDTLVVNGDSSPTNVITKTPGQITWGSPVTETVYRSGIPNTTINANGTSQNSVNDPGSNTIINGGPGTNTITITATTGNGVVINGGPHANNYVITMGSLLGPVTINSTAGTSTVTVYGPPGSNVLTLTPTQLTGVGQTINLNLGTTVTNITVDGSAGNDQLVVQGTPPGPLTARHIAPTVGAITAPSAPVALTTAVSVSAPFSELDGSGVTAVWAWGDGTTSAGTVTQTGTSGSVSGSHPYAADGVYTVTLTVTNPNQQSGQSVFQYVVVYNPSAGFTTGSGSIISPAGAYAANPLLTGQANFGLNARYHSGATVPTGNTDFRFPAANLTFQSTSYDWLVITTSQAQYQGSGTINGAGNYGFLVTAQDNGGHGADLFRLKIWDKSNNNAVVYDTQPGAATTAGPTTALGGGRIQVHTNAQLVDGGANAGGGSVAPLTPAELQPVVAEAIALWKQAGIDPGRLSALGQVTVGIADFPGPWLGMAFPQAIWIDRDAAGYGWFLDPTPATDAEFPAAPDSAAYGRIDLLTVVEHELGHELGFGDTTGDGLMGQYLAPGMRRLPTSADPVAVNARSAAPAVAAPAVALGTAEERGADAVAGLLALDAETGGQADAVATILSEWPWTWDYCNGLVNITGTAGVSDHGTQTSPGLRASTATGNLAADDRFGDWGDPFAIAWEASPYRRKV
jgi:hypothetical protein